MSEEKQHVWTDENVAEGVDLIISMARMIAKKRGDRSPVQVLQLIVDSGEAVLKSRDARRSLLNISGSVAILLLAQMEEYAPGFLDAFKYRDHPTEGEPLIMEVNAPACVVLDAKGRITQAVHPGVAMEFASILGLVITETLQQVEKHSRQLGKLIQGRAAEGGVPMEGGAMVVPVTPEDLFKILRHEHTPDCKHGKAEAAEPPPTGQYL